MRPTVQSDRNNVLAFDRKDSARSVALKHLHVLLVEDEPDVADLFTFVLEFEGAKVVLAGSALEALKKLSAFRLDLLVCNVKLPDHDGTWLLRQIRAQGITQQQLPAIAVSSYTREIYGSDVLAAGFQSFLSKPLNPDDLVKEVLLLTSGNEPSQNNDRLDDDRLAAGL